jgi:hypothetical protein
MGKAGIIIQILVLTNNYALRWSLGSSVLSPFTRFWNNLTVLQAAAVISALVLTIGAVVEYWYKLKLLAGLALKWVLRKSTPFDRCVFRKLLLHSVGPIFVVLGIAGEFIFEGRTFVVEDRQEAEARQIVGSLSDKAAVVDAKLDSTASKSDAVSKEADAIQKRLDGASGQLNEVEQQVRIQGPRRKLLEDNRDKFLEAIKPFAGQRVTVVKCGYMLQAEPEQLEQYLLNLLGVSKASNPNAGWAVESPGYTTWAKCNTGASAVGGNLVIVSSTADRTVKAAATALYNALNRIDISTIQTEAAPEGRQLELQFLGNDSPWELAIKDPTAVIVLIGTNPMFDLSGWHKRHK